MARHPLEKETANEKLDRLVRRERMKRLAPIALALLLVLGGFGVWSGEPWDKGDRLGSTIVRFAKPQWDTWRPTLLIVELDSGAVVKLGGSENLLFEKGRRVVVQEHVSQILGRRRYSFLAYEDGVSGNGNQP